MQIVIEIPDSVYEHLKETTEDSHDESIAIDAIIHGVKIGQTVYEPFIKGIHERTVKKIIYDTGTLAFDKDAIGTSVFLTKEKAEKRMEELGKWVYGYYKKSEE